jgi:hypothetical protein
MALRDWISGSGRNATANIAIVATVRPPPLQQEAVVNEEKKENKPRPTGLQSGETWPAIPGVSKNSSLVSVICTNCERFEMVDFPYGTGNPVPGCLYPAEGIYPDGWKRIPEGLKECMWEKRSQSLNH